MAVIHSLPFLQLSMSREYEKGLTNAHVVSSAVGVVEPLRRLHLMLITAAALDSTLL